MSIWSSVGIDSGKEVTLYDHDGYGNHLESSVQLDVATPMRGWNAGVRLLALDNGGRFPDDGVLDRDSAVLLRDRLSEAILKLDWEETHRGGKNPVTKLSRCVPVSIEELIDAGYPPPSGYVAPTPPRIKRRHRLLWWTQDKRRQLGLWIAGEVDD